MQVTLKILRIDPAKDQKPTWHTYQVEAEPWDRVLDLLHKVKWDQDGTL
ncbi:2Fe-2S iron-sulfur cluster-binding protein, partial [Acinetobacter baumannii]